MFTKLFGKRQRFSELNIIYYPWINKAFVIAQTLQQKPLFHQKSLFHQKPLFHKKSLFQQKPLFHKKSLWAEATVFHGWFYCITKVFYDSLFSITTVFTTTLHPTPLRLETAFRPLCLTTVCVLHYARLSFLYVKLLTSSLEFVQKNYCYCTWN